MYNKYFNSFIFCENEKLGLYILWLPVNSALIGIAAKRKAVAEINVITKDGFIAGDLLLVKMIGNLL